jgi:hypothetical protein
MQPPGLPLETARFIRAACTLAIVGPLRKGAKPALARWRSFRRGFMTEVAAVRSRLHHDSPTANRDQSTRATAKPNRRVGPFAERLVVAMPLARRSL